MDDRLLVDVYTDAGDVCERSDPFHTEPSLQQASATSLSSFLQGVPVDVNKYRKFKCFFHTSPVTEDKLQRQKEQEADEPRESDSLWCQIFLPCRADPRCIHKDVGRWAPAAEFVSL